MIVPDQFHFLRPYWLLAFIPLFILVWWIYKRKIGSRGWESVCDRELLPYILVGNPTAVTRVPALLAGMCGILAILALAGPVWQKLPQPVFTARSALVIALDLSASMDATDISPSRLDRARFKISDILARRMEGQTALLVYAGDAFTVTPLTEDTATIDSMLRALTADIMPVQGNRTDLALSKAVELLKRAGTVRGDILLLTDEVDFERAGPMVQTLRSDGYRLSILGIGTPQGAPVPRSDGSFLKDRSGRIVIPTLNEAPMRELANLGGGRYLRMEIDDRDVNELVRLFSSEVAAGEVAEAEFETDVWREEGPWLLVLLAPLAALAFRRGYLVVLLSLALPCAQPVQASTVWDSLWLRPDQQAKRAMEEGDYGKAVELFTDPAWKATAAYRAGRFAEAEKWLDGLDGTVNRYNRANTLARQGRYEEAIALYERVLEQAPDHEDARFNKELLEKELEQQQQQSQQQQQEQQQQEQEQQEQQQQQADRQEQSPEQGQEGDPDQQNEQDSGNPGRNKQSEDEQQSREAEQDTEQASSASREHTGQDDEAIQDQDPRNMNREEYLAGDDATADEEKQATEQWLRRIPDDPSELLRRKFLYQYQQRQEARVPGEKSW